MGAFDNQLLTAVRLLQEPLEPKLGELRAQIAASAGNVQDTAFIADACTAVNGLPPSAEAVGCLLEGAKWHLVAGQAAQAFDPADDAVRMAQALADPKLLWRAYNLVGALHLQTLDYPGAIGALRRSLQLVTELNDDAARIMVVTNIGAAHHYAGQFSEAMDAYDHVLTLSKASSVGRGAAKPTLNNIAYCALQSRDHARGIAAAEESIEIDAGDSPIAQMHAVQLEHTYVRLLVEVRSFDKAREHAKIAQQIAGKSGSPLLLNLALSAQAIVDVATGAVDIGLTRLRNVVDRARKGAEANLIDALLVSARGYTMAGQADIATLQLHEVAALNGRVRMERLKMHHERHVRNVRREWDERYAQAEADQRRELDEQMASGVLLASQTEFLERAALAAELYDDSTGYHVYRVGSMTREMARARGMDEATCRLVEVSARQHDIGKVVVPEAILNKPGRFTPEERAIMETHAEAGARLIRETAGNLPQMHIAEEIAHGHHEKWDGTGYPRKLKGTQIPLSARITAIADVFDALTHRRCYKEAWTVTDALKEIANGRGTHFDPELTDIFFGVVNRLTRETGDLESYLIAPAANSAFIKDREAINRELRGQDGVFEVRR